MDDKTKLKFFFVIFCFCSYLNINSECGAKSTLFICLAVLHTLIAVYNTVGWAFDSKYLLVIYIISASSVLTLWTFNDWQCILSEFEAASCGRKYVKKSPIPMLPPYAGDVVYTAFLLWGIFISVNKLATPGLTF